jgi:phosphohistidine phosphatase SixA
MRRTVPFLLLFSFVISAATAFAQPATIVLVRHAEKAGPDGDVPLSEAGRTRAEALANVLRSAKVSAIFVTDTQRTQQTAAPIAKALKLTPEVTKGADTVGLAATLRKLPAGSVALVVNHSNTSTELATALGAEGVAPILDTEFDRMMILTRAAAGKFHLVTLRYGAPTPTP